MGQYESNPAADAAIATLRRFVRMLISWSGVREEQLPGLAECLFVLHKFPHIDEQVSVTVSLEEPLRKAGEGYQQLTWSISICPEEITADIAGYFRGERGMDAMTTCEFNACDGEVQYDDYRHVHIGSAAGQLFLPVFDQASLDELNLCEEGVELTVE